MGHSSASSHEQDTLGLLHFQVSVQCRTTVGLSCKLMMSFVYQNMM